MTNLPVDDVQLAPKQSYIPLIWMIASQLIGLLSLIPWLVMAGLSFMAFDSGETPQAWLFVGTVLSYPLLPIGCSILAWVLWTFKKRRAALVATSLPFVIVLLLVVVAGLFMLPSLIP